MQSQVTLKELKARALDYADMTGSDYPEQDRLTDYINSGLSELHDMLASDSIGDYFRSEQTITLVSGTEAYALPADFYKAIGVYYVSTGRRFNIERWNPMDIDGYRTSPISGGTVHLWYVPQLQKFHYDSDEGAVIGIPIPVGWEDFVALHAASRLLLKADLDPTGLQRERELQRRRITDAISPRDQFIPDAIGDWSDRWQDTRHLLRFDNRQFKYRIQGKNIYFIEVEWVGA